MRTSWSNSSKNSRKNSSNRLKKRNTNKKSGVKKVGELDQFKEFKSALPDEGSGENNEPYIEEEDGLAAAVGTEAEEHMALLLMAKDTIEKQEKLLNLLRVDSATLIDGIQRIAKHNAEKPNETITRVLEVLSEYFSSEDYKKQVALLKEI